MLHGTIETISKINKDILYKCYNTFYTPSNMCIVVCGDFEPEILIKEIEKRLIKKSTIGDIQRIAEKEEKKIVKELVEQKMSVTNPLFTIGIKCEVGDQFEKVKKHIAIEIILNILIGESSETFKELYEAGFLFNVPDLSYEFGNDYAHILISEKSNNPEEVYKKVKEKIKELMLNGVPNNDFNRIKKMIYGEYIKEYDDVSEIARMFLSDFMKGLNSFEYLEEIQKIDLNYINDVLKKNFKKEKMVLSVVRK